MVSLDDELQRRREKGRRSQAAFRKRQAKAQRDTEAENLRLRESLDAIARAASADDRAELIQTIRRAAEASGSNTHHLQAARSKSPLRATDLSIRATRNENSHNRPSQSVLDLIAGGAAPRSPTQPQAYSHRVPYTTPVFNLWLDPLRFLRITTPPEDIVPYLGAGKHTFAGRLFWRVMEHAETTCRHMHHRPLDAAGRRADIRWFRRLTAHSRSLHVVRAPRLEAMAMARLEFARWGFMDADGGGHHGRSGGGDGDYDYDDNDHEEWGHAGARESGIALLRLVEAEYAATGRDTALYLSPLAVGARVRALLGPELWAALEAAALGADGTRERELLRGAFDIMMDSYVCFGDGPRWTSDFVDETILRWTGISCPSTSRISN